MPLSSRLSARVVGDAVALGVEAYIQTRLSVRSFGVWLAPVAGKTARHGGPCAPPHDPAALAGGNDGRRGGDADALAGVERHRPPAGRRPPRDADPGLPRRRRVARSDDALAARPRLPH